MKICFVMLRAYPVFQPELKEKFGGAEVQVYLLSRELAKDPEFEVSCISRDYGQRDGEVIEGVCQHKIFQGGPLFARVPGVNKALSAWGLYQTLKRINADIYVQRCAAVETGITAHYCWKHNRKFVYSFASDKDVDERLDKIETPSVVRSFNYGLRHCHASICQNEYQRDRARARWKIDPVILPSLQEIKLANWQFPKGKTILWVGRGVALKQAEIFYDLACYFPNQQFVIIMPPGPEPEYFEKSMAEGRLIPNLQLHTYVPYQETDQFFSQARVLVNTSTYEGFPNTFLQAMKFGVPVLSLSVNPNEILTRERVGLCAGGDVNKLRDHLDLLLRDDNLYRTLSLRAWEYMVRTHDAARIVGEYKKLFQSLIAR